jgi:hypothetical protein
MTDVDKTTREWHGWHRGTPFVRPNQHGLTILLTTKRRARLWFDSPADLLRPIGMRLLSVVLTIWYNHWITFILALQTYGCTALTCILHADLPFWQTFNVGFPFWQTCEERATRRVTFGPLCCADGRNEITRLYTCSRITITLSGGVTTYLYIHCTFWRRNIDRISCWPKAPEWFNLPPCT